jgi:two-component system, NarL family, invasion response regulator UvrY
LKLTRLYIADDHFLIREGLKKLLRDEFDFKVVGEARMAGEVLDGIRKSNCDILVLDLALPDKPGLDVLKDVKSIFPKVRVLILSTYPEDRFAIRTLKAGADGYLSKDTAAEELVIALRRIAAGRRYFSEAVLQDLAQAVQDGGNYLPHEILSDREFEVFCLIGSGKTITEIASELNVSISTVNTHRLHILEKMKMQSNAQLMRYALENKLID